MEDLTGWELDHVVIVVDDLETAIDRFETLGFQVVRGGRTGPVHNALIYLADGTYLELTCPVSHGLRLLFRTLRGIGLLHLFQRLRPGLMHRFYNWFGGPTGLRDWCLRTPDLDLYRRSAEAAGTRMAETRAFQRVRPDGSTARWRLTAPLDHREPFWIEDITPISLRVPWQEHCQHPNGVRGIRALVVRSPPALELGQLPVRVDSMPSGTLHLELETIGERTGPLPRTQTCGASIAFVPDQRSQ